MAAPAGDHLAQLGDAARIRADIEAIAAFGRVGPTAVTRLAFTAEDGAAHEHVAGLMRAAGLETRYDAFGNLFGRCAGIDPEALPVVTGSHLDGPPDGGMFDGVAGVACGLEAIRMLDAAGVTTRHPIEVAAIRCEHLDRFGLSCLGSRALSGKLEQDDLERLRDDDGVTLARAVDEAGFSSCRLESVRLAGRVEAFVELHIEQGRVLEDAGESLALVTAIAGPTRFHVRLAGSADHSGGTPMSLRRDALCGAAEIVLELERMAGATASCVGTVGILRARPGAVHTIPGDVELYVDIRGTDAEAKAELVGAFAVRMHEIAERRGLGIVSETSVDEPPVPCSARLLDALRDALDGGGFRYVELPSGGGHDTQHLARCTDAAMLFVPSVGGISHTPEERTDWDDLALGAGALAACLRRVAAEAACS